MKKICSILITLMFCLMAISAYAQERGTASDAKTILKNAVAYVKANGNQKALKEFDNPKGAFVKKDVYIYSLNEKGDCLQHYANKSLVGKNFMELKDADGKPFIKNIIDGTKTKSGGQIDYRWTHPSTKKIEQKSAYYEKVKDLILICGYYK